MDLFSKHSGSKIDTKEGRRTLFRKSTSSSLSLMRKIWLLITCCWGALLLLPAHSLFSQSIQEYTEGIRLGAKAGIVASYIGGTVESISVGKLMLGGVAKLEMQGKVDVKAELLLAGQGAADATRTNKNGRWNYLYVNVPLLVSYAPFPDQAITLEGGMQIGSLLRASYADDRKRHNIKAETRKFDLAVVVGVAWHVESDWVLDARYTGALFNHSIRGRSEGLYLNQTVQFGVSRFFW